VRFHRLAVVVIVVIAALLGAVGGSDPVLALHAASNPDQVGVERARALRQGGEHVPVRAHDVGVGVALVLDRARRALVLLLLLLPALLELVRVVRARDLTRPGPVLVRVRPLQRAAGAGAAPFGVCARLAVVSTATAAVTSTPSSYSGQTGVTVNGGRPRAERDARVPVPAALSPQ
jgi:hypothetical protein